MPEQITPEEIVLKADKAEYLLNRAEMAVAVSFEETLTAEDRAKIQQRVKEVLEAALRDGQLVPPDARLPRPRRLSVQPLPYRCEHCHTKVSPFILI